MLQILPFQQGLKNCRCAEKVNTIRCNPIFANVFFFMFLLVTQLSNAQTITKNETGDHGGFYYSFWNEGGGGSVSMTLGPNGNYTTSWTNCTNFTAGKGWRTGTPNRVINFTGTYDGGTNGFLAVYGWTRNPLIEYYVVETHGEWVPPGGNSKGTFQSDGGTYKIYQTTRTQQPSIDGIRTFEQYWCVRTEKRSSGTVTFANHVAAWKNANMNLGTSWDYQIMESEGYRSSGSSNITVSEGTITGALDESRLNASAALEVYPHPVSDKLTFDLPELPLEVSLHALSGAEIKVFHTASPKVEMDLSGLESGIYLLKVVTEKQTYTKKIAKR